MIHLFKLIICLQFFVKNINTCEQKNFMSAERSSVTLNYSPLTKQITIRNFKNLTAAVICTPLPERWWLCSLCSL